MALSKCSVRILWRAGDHFLLCQLYWTEPPLFPFQKQGLSDKNNLKNKSSSNSNSTNSSLSSNSFSCHHSKKSMPDKEDRAKKHGIKVLGSWMKHKCAIFGLGYFLKGHFLPSSVQEEPGRGIFQVMNIRPFWGFSMWKWQNALCFPQVHSSISTVWLHVNCE